MENGTLVINGLTCDGATSKGSSHGPVPSSLTVTYSDVDYNSGRTADGMMHRNRKGTKVSLDIEFPPMSPTKVKRVLRAVSAKKFSVKYLDPKANARITKSFYCGDRSVPVFNYGLGVYDSMSFSLVEY